MKSRSIKVRQIFSELRRTIGLDIPAGELLRFAAALVDATAPLEERDQHEGVGPRPAVDVLPLDKAFEDGGWCIMEVERRWVRQSCWDDDPGFAVSRRIKHKAGLAA
jgi:hypothetical protein